MDFLVEEEEGLLKELRERIADLDWREDDLEDKNLIRFLRARSCDLDEAERMIRNHHQWTVTEDMKNLLATYESPKGWDESFYYAMTGFDRTHCPLFIASFGKWDVHKETALGNKEEFVKFVYYSIERLMALLKRVSKEEHSMRQVVGIIDLEGLSLRQVTSLDVVEAVIRCLKAFEANFPEIIKAAVIVNAPWAFQIIWKLIKPFLSERTHSKLDFIGKDKEKWREAILSMADPNQFPVRYGGTAPDTTKFFIGRDGSWSTSENQNEEYKINHL